MHPPRRPPPLLRASQQRADPPARSGNAGCRHRPRRQPRKPTPVKRTIMAMSETLLRQDEMPAPSYRSLDEGLAAAEAARSRGDGLAALGIFAELREQFPDHAAAYLRAVAMLSQLRRFDEAEQLLTNGNARFREDSGFAIERGWLAYRRGNLDDAVERWREIREAMPGHQIGYTAGA